MKDAKKFVHVHNAFDRSGYAAVLKKIRKAGVCPFCPKNFKYHTRPILKNTKCWIVTENMNPYAGARHHFLFIHKKHIETIADMSARSWGELHSHIAWLSKKHKLPGGSLFIRFGDARYTGASVAHLHAQLIVGVPKNKSTFTIGPTLSFGAKK